MNESITLWDRICDAMKEMANDNDMIHDKVYDVTDHIMERIYPLIAAKALEEAADDMESLHHYPTEDVHWLRWRAAKLREAPPDGRKVE